MCNLYRIVNNFSILYIFNKSLVPATGFFTDIGWGTVTPLNLSALRLSTQAFSKSTSVPSKLKERGHGI